MTDKQKIVIYQVLTRVFGNRNLTRKENGSIAENGVGKMNDFSPAVLKRIRDLGATHIWYTGVIRHATTTDYSQYGIPTQHTAIVKGKAGSPYAIADYYDIDPDIAENVDRRMEEWEHLIDRTHRVGLKVIIDFVPNHVARQYQSIAKPAHVRDLGENDDTAMNFSIRNNFYYCTGQPFAPRFSLKASNGQSSYSEFPAKATGNDFFGASPDVCDWYETVKLNYGIDYCDAAGRSCHFVPMPDTWRQMSDILLFWAAKGVDGFRCDMAEMVPVDFWNYATDTVREKHPEIVFIGEVYDKNQYRAYAANGFDYLYDKVGMYDCVRKIICGDAPASDITRQWQAVDDILPRMLYFLENHDEQRIASRFFCSSSRRAIPGLMVSALLNTNPLMIYAGQEFGEPGMDHEGFSGTDGRTSIFDYWCVDTIRRGYFDRRELRKAERELSVLYRQILTIARSSSAVTVGRFFDLMYANPCSEHFDTASLFAFVRCSSDETLLVVVNFSDRSVDVRLNIPAHAFDCLQMAEGKRLAADLLTAERQSVDWKRNCRLPLTVNAYSGRIYRIEG